MVSHTTYEATRAIEPIYTGGPVALSQDDLILATSLGEDVLLTGLENGQRLARVEGDGEITTSISITPNASHLITCSRSLSMRIHSLHPTSAETITVELLRAVKPHTTPVISSVTDSTGSLLATGASDGTLKIWDIRGGYSTHSFHGHNGVVSALIFFKVREADNFSEKEATSKKRRSGERKSLQDDDEFGNREGLASFRLASGDEEGKIRIWDLKKRKCVVVLDSHVSVVRGLDFNEVEQILLSASRDKTVMLWDTSTWRTNKTIPILEEVEAAGFLSQTGDLIYTGGSSGRLRLWWTSGHEATDEQKQAADEGQTIVDVIHHAGQSFILSVHANQNFHIHALPSLKGHPGHILPPLSIERRISGTHDEIIDLAYVGREADFIAVATNLEDLKILSLRSSSAPPRTRNFLGADVGILQGHEDIIICIDADWSGNWLATGAKDNTARLWRIDPENSSFSCYAILTGHAESLGAIALPKQHPPVGSVAFKSPLDYPPQYVLTGSQDRTVKLWDTGGMKNAVARKPPRAVYTRKAHDKDVNALDINHDSSLFLSASQDRTVKIWSFEDGEVVGVLRGHKRGVWSAKFSPKDTPLIVASSGNLANGARGYVLTGSGDKTVKIWSINDFTCLRTFEGHTNSVLKVLWMDNSMRASSTAQSTTEDGDVESDAEKRGRKDSPSRDCQVASAGSDGLVKLWEVNSSECACTLDNHTDRVWALALNPKPAQRDATLTSGVEAHTLISGGADATLTFWLNTTTLTTHLTAVASNRRIEQDQALQNYIRSRAYRPAILLALRLDHPARLLSLFTEAVKTWPKQQGSLTGVKEVDVVLGELSDEDLLALLGRCREWNASAKSSTVAQTILWALFKIYPASRLIGLKAPNHYTSKLAVKGLGPDRNSKDILDSLRVYTERHFKRLEELIDESFLIDFTLREMDEVIGTSAPPAASEPTLNTNGIGVNGDTLGHDKDGDATMSG